MSYFLSFLFLYWIHIFKKAEEVKQIRKGNFFLSRAGNSKNDNNNNNKKKNDDDDDDE